ncbi:hypothetical protein STFR1_30423 [Bacillus vallismortis]
MTVCLHAEAAAVQAEAADVKCPDETGRLVFTYKRNQAGDCIGE